jgi:hypothetical protein
VYASSRDASDCRYHDLNRDDFEPNIDSVGTLLSTYLSTPIRHVFADQGFAGRLVDWSAESLKTTLEIVRKPAGQQGFVVHRNGGWWNAASPG